jgi:hypothetical protein
MTAVRETGSPAAIVGPRVSPDPVAALPWAHRAYGVTMRPATEHDIPALDGFVSGLSSDTAYLRFFVGVGRLPLAMLRMLTSGPGRSCWIAEDWAGTPIGHACAALLPETSAADVAIVVTDAWQGMGIGPALARRAVDTLPGIRTLHLTTLTINQRVRRMVLRYWPDAVPQLGDGLWTYRVPAYAS